MVEDEKIEPTTPVATQTETTHENEVTQVHLPEETEDDKEENEDDEDGEEA